MSELLGKTIALPNEQDVAAYGEQLARWARAMVSGQIDEVQADLGEGFTLDHVGWFVDGNVEKRILTVLSFLEFVDAAFDDLEKLVEEYVMQNPFPAMISPTDDAEACLVWIEQNAKLTPEQRDYVACQRARHAVEAAAGKNRLAHVRFQEILSLAPRLLDELESNPDLQIQLNPIHVWSRFHTRALLDANDPLPAEVLFFAIGGSITTTVLNADARALVEELAAGGPWTLESWACVTGHTDRDGLIQLCRDLSGMGLVAFG